MPASGPRRRKIAAIIILTGQRTVTDIDNGTPDIDETIFWQLCRGAKIEATHEDNWTSAQLAVWNQISVISDMYAANVPADYAKASSDLETALGNAGL